MTEEQRKNRKKPKRYGVSNLPEGKWTPTVKPRRDHLYSGFGLVLTDAGTGDRVEAIIVEGDYQYSPESMGIPVNLDPKCLWHLARIEPRISKAYGGTIAAIQHLAAEADKKSVWIMTEVMTEIPKGNPAVIRVLKKYGKFKDAADPALRPRVLVRPPKSSNRP